MFENLSIGHLAVVLVIFLLLFGAKRIPEIAGSLGQGINEFKKTMSGAGEPTPVAAPPRESVPIRDASSGSTVVASVVATDDASREPKRLF
jgi:sec-independent protein translocase protein TatA